MGIAAIWPTGAAAGFLAALARIGGAVAMLPLPGFRGAAPVVRVLFAFALTVVLLPAWPEPSRLSPVTLLAEAALGCGTGVLVGWLNEAFTIAMQVAGTQAGYTYAATIDPTTQADSTVLQTVAQLTAAAMFVAAGLDREVIRIFAHSLETNPPGHWLPGFGAELPASKVAAYWGALAAWTGEMFRLAVRLALPVAGLLLVVDVTLALLGRLDAHLQLLTLAFPLKMLAAMLTIGAWTATMGSLYIDAAHRMFPPLHLWLGGNR